MAPRLVRRRPLIERISAYNPFDLYVALSIWFESHDWDGFQNTVANPLGLTLNILCLISRANSGRGGRRGGAEDVLRHPGGGPSSGGDSGLSYFFWILSWVLAIGSVANAAYCFMRKKRYRLFESNIGIEPTTPSARRVRVDSSPTNTTPLRLLAKLVEPFSSSPEHPDETRDVWEVSVWDPTPLSLRIFGLFSPAHVLVYFLSLPIASNPPLPNSLLVNFPVTPATNPVRTIVTVLATQFILSAQTIYFQGRFVQQAKDTTLIHKEVLHEYDQKYVRPRLNVLKRDVAVQTADCRLGETASVNIYTPTFNRQGFRTAPNPNYSGLTMQNQLGYVRAPPTTTSRSTATPFPIKGSIRQPKFGSTRRSTSTLSFDGPSLRTSFDDDEDGDGDDGNDATAVGRGEESSERSAPRRAHTPNLGMHALVSMSTENSKRLSPSKSDTPLKKGSSVRGSSYAASLGGSFATPVRRNAGYY